MFASFLFQRKFETQFWMGKIYYKSSYQQMGVTSFIIVNDSKKELYYADFKYFYPYLILEI